MKKFELSNYYDLLNLHKALMEAKFHDNPDNKYIAGSPIIAKIINQIVDILAEIDPHANKSDWESWRKLENHMISEHKFKFEKSIWDKILDRVSEDDLWPKYTREEKIIATKNYFSPFILSKLEIENFINDVEMNEK